MLAIELNFTLPGLEHGKTLEPRLESRCERYVFNDHRTLSEELGLGGVLLAKQPLAVPVLTAISAPGEMVETRKGQLAADSVVSLKEQQAVVRGLIELGENNPPMREILKCRAAAHLTDFDVFED